MVAQGKAAQQTQPWVKLPNNAAFFVIAPGKGE